MNVLGLTCYATGVDVPGARSSPHLNYAILKGNPVRESGATIALGVAADDRIQIAVYDIVGRRVRTLADRRFKQGQYELLWDGRDNTGARLRPGVYFTRVRYRESGFETARKVTILR
jgi:flagellar hook assembly protein FlgD